MGQEQDIEQLRGARAYLQALCDRDERRELQIAIALLEEELQELGAEPQPTDSPSLPEPEEDLIPPHVFEAEERASVRDRERERKRRRQMRLDQLTAERVQALKSDVLRYEETRLELLDKQDAEVAAMDQALRKLAARVNGLQRRREQATKDEKTLREELDKRQRLVKEDEQSLGEIREHVARLRRELDTAAQREQELSDTVARNTQRIKTEETALAEVTGRRTQLEENEQEAARESQKLREQRDGLKASGSRDFSKLEDEFLRAHWSSPPISEQHLKEALRASVILLSVNEAVVRERLAALGLSDNVSVVPPPLDEPTLGEAAPEPSAAHASLQHFLKIVKA